MPNLSEAPLAALFHALGDPTRLAVLERLARGPASVSELAKPFAMALPSFTQHLSVLEEAGLVVSKKEGRVRTCELNPPSLAQAQSWLARRRELWERRLDRLDAYLLDLKEKGHDHDKPGARPRPGARHRRPRRTRLEGLDRA